MRKLFIFFIFIIGCLVIYAQLTRDRWQENHAALSDLKDSKEFLIRLNSCNNISNNESIQPQSIRERALLMSKIKWSPKSNITNNRGYFIKGDTIIGLPYSSVKELQKFIGLDVSIYTFLTAVNNPYSLLYSENVGAGNKCYLGGIYNGQNSHTFYGTVCSSFTAFCYGENYNYTSFNYRRGQVPNYSLKKSQDLKDLTAGDLYWCPGHVGLVTEIIKDSLGNISNIEFFESAGIKVVSKKYTSNDFLRRLSGNGNPQKQGYLYENRLVEKSSTKHSKQNTDIQNNEILSTLESMSISPMEICTWFGDRPCIGEWDKLMINFHKKQFDKIIISLNDVPIDTLDISDKDNSIEYKPKEAGIFKAHLASASQVSPIYTSFEVLDTTTKILYTKNDTVEVIFAEDSDPEIIYWVNKVGDQHTFPISIPEEAKKKGRITLDLCTKKDAMVRVIYRGQYGRAINKPEHLVL